ncbi:MAG: hypothetical protein FJX71_05885 [Alphaproteobacteria bacterium]|nr:hypothetical protein [Alphaproteobacteria bacterium]
MVKNNRLEKIETQINQLHIRKRKLENKRSDQLIKFINRCGANKLPNEILAGAVIEVVRAVGQKDKRISQWESEGRTILKPGRGRKKFL